MSTIPSRGAVAVALVTGFAVLATTGCFEISTGAAEGEPEEASDRSKESSELPYAYRSYADKVKALRKLPDDPELTVDDAPPVGSTIEQSPEEWREELTEEEFHILRESGTERAGSGDLLDNHATGVYRCAGCGAPLFSSRDKFHSDTGWPSFTEPYQKGRVDYSKDGGPFGYRVEVHCARCGGHLGHVFNDGPEPTGKRYCINSAALDFQEVAEEK